MAGKYLQISRLSFPSTLDPPPSLRRRPPQLLPLPFPPHAASSSDGDEESETADGSPSSADAVFEKRLDQVRLKYRSGTGKKAEQRKARKSSPGGGVGKKKGSVMLPPVPLREPVAAGGVPVEVGFNPYSDRLNGLLAGLGLAALLLVELGSGQGLFLFHAPPVIFIQIYTVAAAAAVFVKYEKERISVWPEKTPSPPPAT